MVVDQLIAHAVGDYVIQSDWMATEKTRRSVAAATHAVTYLIPFLFLTRSVAALAVMGGTHFVIDRWRLARYVVWISNFAAPPGTNPPWPECTATGFPPDRPPFLTVWILIIVDNLMHIGINAAALTWF